MKDKIKNLLWKYGGCILLVGLFTPIKAYLEEWQKFMIGGFVLLTLFLIWGYNKYKMKHGPIKQRREKTSNLLFHPPSEKK